MVKIVTIAMFGACVIFTSGNKETPEVSDGSVPIVLEVTKEDIDQLQETVQIGRRPFPTSGVVLSQSITLDICEQRFENCVGLPEDAFPIFHSRIEELSDKKKSSMLNVTWREGCPIPFEDLRSVLVLHWDIEEGIQWGEIILHTDVAKEIQTVFQELYYQRFPIQSLKPMVHFNGSDDASMAANNTSGFNCRNIKNTNRYSEHSYGQAIDVNPFLNPWVKGTRVDPADAVVYVDRTQDIPGLIKYDDVVVQIFKNQGWSWGGNWNSLKDYQHFSKSGR